MTVRQGEGGPRLLLLAVLAALLFAAVLPSVRPMIDADIFWHLATGRWIVEHRAFPTVDPFSVMGTEHGARWIAYSWLFELGVYGLYRADGWVGISVYTMVLAASVTVLLFGFLRRREDRLALPAVVSLLAVLALWPIFTPRPWLVTLFFFLIQLRLLLEVRASGRERKLWLLIPLFAIWANLHIQFVYGLFFLGLFAAEALWREGRAGRIRHAAPWLIACFGSALATFLNPYGWDLVRVVFEYALEPLPPVQELVPPDFSHPSEWIVLALGSAAVVSPLLVRPRRLFPCFLAAVGLALFLHSRRDTWASVALSAAVLGDVHPWPRPKAGLLAFRAPAVSPALGVAAFPIAVAFLFASGDGTALRNATHERRQAEVYPVAATNYLRRELAAFSGPDSLRVGAPLFNPFDWGGYLIWSLPELPVALDGRTNLHTPERLFRAWATLDGEPGWETDPDLVRARTVLLETPGPLASRLRATPGFHPVYRDSVATVFVARQR